MKIQKKTFSLAFSQWDSNNELKWKPYYVFVNTGLHNAIIKNTDPCVSLICPRVVICADHYFPYQIKNLFKNLSSLKLH